MCACVCVCVCVCVCACTCVHVTSYGLGYLFGNEEGNFFDSGDWEFSWVGRTGKRDCSC